MRLHRCPWCGYTHNQDAVADMEAEVKRLKEAMREMAAEVCDTRRPERGGAVKRDYCSDCGTTYDTRGLCACTEPDWLRAEVQRLQSEVQRLQASALPSEGAYISGRVDGERIGFRAGQEAMRERCAVRVDRAANEACECDGTLCGPGDAATHDEDCQAWDLDDLADAIRALEVE